MTRASTPPTTTLRRGAIAIALAACALVLAPAGATGSAARAGDDSGAGGAPAAEPAPTKDFISALGDADETVRKAASDALVKIGPAAVPDLAAALANTKLREGVAGVIERLGPSAKDAVPVLTGIVKSAWSPARTAAVRALGAIGADAAPATSALALVVGAPSAKDRVEAIVAIDRILAGVAARIPRNAATPGPADRVIAAGCDWLMRHQSEGGRWDCDGFTSECSSTTTCGDAGEPAHDAGVTGLALLALLGMEGPPDARRQGAIDAGLTFLLAVQDKDGIFGPRTHLKFQYDHACASLAVIDAYAGTQRADLKASAERAVAYVLSAQNPYLAWRYVQRDGDNDTSATAWMAQVLGRAEQAGLSVPVAWRPGACAWVDKMTDPEEGRTGYQSRGGLPTRSTNAADAFPAEESESMTAAGLLVRMSARSYDEADSVARGFDLLARCRPAWEGRATADFYYWMLGSKAMRLGGGSDYAGWRTALQGALVPRQFARAWGCFAGSWPRSDPWINEGGKVYTTAAAVIALETCNEDPAARPAVPSVHSSAKLALQKASNDADVAVRSAAKITLRRVASMFRH